MAQSNAENMGTEAQRMAEEAESLRQLAGNLKLGLDEDSELGWRLQPIKRMAENLERAATLYRQAQMEYNSLYNFPNY